MVTVADQNAWTSVCGLDEAGRGALAGPLVAAAVQMHLPLERIQDQLPFPLRDGKLLSPRQRAQVYETVLGLRIRFSVLRISTGLINNRGIGWANREIFRRLIRQIDAPRYILDGNLRIGVLRGKEKSIYSIIDADATIGPVILAGIIAKVERDAIMHRLHAAHPQYGWDHNAGYGTAGHIRSLELFGTCRYHRTQFVTTALRNRHGNGR